MKKGEFPGKDLQLGLNINKKREIYLCRIIKITELKLGLASLKSYDKIVKI